MNKTDPDQKRELIKTTIDSILEEFLPGWNEEILFSWHYTNGNPELDPLEVYCRQKSLKLKDSPKIRHIDEDITARIYEISPNSLPPGVKGNKFIIELSVALYSFMKNDPYRIVVSNIFADQKFMKKYGFEPRIGQYETGLRRLR